MKTLVRGAVLRAAVLTFACALGVESATAQTAPAQATAAAVANEYRLGSGDVIRVSVYQNPDLLIETRVSEAGVISVPLLGTVSVGGLSVTAAEKLIADGLRTGNFVKQPQVTVVVLQVRGNQVSVLGQVNRPGRYALEVADMRLTDVLALAGGISAVGSNTVVITGTRNGSAMRQEIDLPSVFAANGRDKDLFVLNGDAVWVDRQPLVYIYGEVQRPGTLRLEPRMTLMQALAAGGGLTQRGTEKGIRVRRRAEDGKTLELTPAMDDLVRDGDVVYVRESLF